MPAAARSAFPSRQACLWGSTSAACCSASKVATLPPTLRLPRPPTATRPFSSGSKTLFVQSSLRRDHKRHDPSSSPSSPDSQKDNREPFTPPPIPEGVDPAEYESANRPADEGAASSGKGAPVLSEEDILRRRRQQRSNNKSPGGAPPPRPWYLSPTTLVLGFIPVFTFGLGYWQIRRLQWKVSLIEELEDKLRREPIRLPKNIK